MKDFLKQEQADILKKIQEQSEYIFSISTSYHIQKKPKAITTTLMRSKRATASSNAPAKISLILTFHSFPKTTSCPYKVNSNVFFIQINHRKDGKLEGNNRKELQQPDSSAKPSTRIALKREENQEGAPT